MAVCAGPKAGGNKMPSDVPRPPRPPAPPEPNLWALFGMGMELAAVVGVGALIGWRLDKWLKTDWLLIVCAMLALVGGLYNLWKRVRKYL